MTRLAFAALTLLALPSHGFKPLAPPRLLSTRRGAATVDVNGNAICPLLEAPAAPATTADFAMA